jgi:uncharacterized Zn finger protein
MSFWSYGWAPRKTASSRRADAARAIARAAKAGKPMAPVVVEGRTIARTFWGKSWCDNLERYRDFAYRLERGRSYLRSGSVIDLRIAAGTIAAKVSGSRIYDVAIEIGAVERAAWKAIQRDCAGHIGSRLDLLAGRLTDAVMARLCADRTGLFPAPTAIQFTCSCPDYASMCKHVAAAMYGVGARLDASPELLFTLRRVSPDELHAAALTEVPAAPRSRRILAADGLASLFGIELAETTTAGGAHAASAGTTRASKAGRTRPKSPPVKASASSRPKPSQAVMRSGPAKKAAVKPSRRIDASPAPAKVRSRARRASDESSRSRGSSKSRRSPR